jgi:hypothetical protein
MKQCPACGTTYTDASLLYCLSDGAPLNAIDDEQNTVVRSGTGPMRVDITQPGVSKTRSAAAAAPPSVPVGSSHVWLKVVLGLLVIGFLIATAVAVGTLIYFNVSRPEVTTNASPTPSVPVSSPTRPTTIDETDELRKQIADLAKRLSEQAASNKPIDIPLNIPNQPASTTRTARVNSPGDGFLALRTFPNSDAGQRIMKIPHGAVLTVGGCLNTTRIGNRSGRWCRASYGGYTGWVFDGWLDY